LVFSEIAKPFSTFALRNEEAISRYFHFGFAANWFLLNQFAAFFCKADYADLRGSAKSTGSEKISKISVNQ